jgi:hypothetical protein
MSRLSTGALRAGRGIELGKGSGKYQVFWNTPYGCPDRISAGTWFLIFFGGASVMCEASTPLVQHTRMCGVVGPVLGCTGTLLATSSQVCCWGLLLAEAQWQGRVHPQR